MDEVQQQKTENRNPRLEWSRCTETEKDWQNVACSFSKLSSAQQVVNSSVARFLQNSPIVFKNTHKKGFLHFLCVCVWGGA